VKRTVITPPPTSPKQKIARLSAAMFQIFGDHTARIEERELRQGE
jgi:hypothetical protein